jgi:hypothetical protein
MDKKFNEVKNLKSSTEDSIDFFDIVSPRLIEHTNTKSPYEFLKYVKTEQHTDSSNTTQQNSKKLK